ncbi:hypothetical protein VZT92_004390 [Zoarces viviparus]|uniref:Uncharacterized protein n=1 Tax=Zoarces viviparus TaxID=48416 RepID=A0AAW1FZV7_ZOAVI
MFFRRTALLPQLMACHSRPGLPMRMGDYNRVSRQETLACPLASFLLHVDHNGTTPLYNRLHIDLGARLAPGTFISHRSRKSLTSRQGERATYLFSLDEMIWLLCGRGPGDIKP